MGRRFGLKPGGTDGPKYPASFIAGNQAHDWDKQILRQRASVSHHLGVGRPPGDTAYTAMPEGSRRASAAVHRAMMSFASAYALLGTYFKFGPLRSRAGRPRFGRPGSIWPRRLAGRYI